MCYGLVPHFNDTTLKCLRKEKQGAREKVDGVSAPKASKHCRSVASELRDSTAYDFPDGEHSE